MTPHTPHNQIHTPHRHQRHASGFTLMEILIVLFIAMGLMAAGVVVMSSVRQRSLEGHTRTILHQLEAVATEYQAQTGEAVPAPDAPPASLDWDEYAIEFFIEQINTIPEAKEMLLVSDRGLLYDDDGEPLAVQDYWSKRVVYWHPQDNYRDSALNTDNYDLPVRPRPYFASAGPSGEWGSYEQLQNREHGESLTAAQNELADLAADNIYSFDLD